MNLFLKFFLVFIGGGAGSVARFGIGFLVAGWQTRFPLATFLSNILACLALGMLAGFHLSGNLTDNRRLLLATGFCGGFSTFSTFTAETWQLFQNRQYNFVFFNVLSNFVVCWICFFLGLKIAVWLLGK